MNITSILLDDLIAAFADALAEANYQIAEKHEAFQNQMREENGPALSALLPNKALRIKSGSITVTAQPVIKEEKGRNGRETRIYLKFGGINKKELTFEVSLEK